MSSLTEENFVENIPESPASVSKDFTTKTQIVKTGWDRSFLQFLKNAGLKIIFPYFNANAGLANISILAVLP